MIIPHERLAPETLDSLIESFVMREGTDYGDAEFSLLDKVEQVRQQIVDGEVIIAFDYQTESINLLPRREIAVLAESDA
ncbi:YheU family protein [Proteobacteria bacterium 005FR1]|nr:YheU family protein [Proteobacteria bacterium 005FR1]